MNKALLVLNIILLIAVGVLYYLHFSGRPAISGSKASKSVKTKNGENVSDFRIAYFEMDSLNENLEIMKEVNAELKSKEDAKARELTRLQDEYQRKLAEYMNAPMNQEQSEHASNDLKQRQQYMNNRLQALEQDYQDFYMRKRNEVTMMIENFLREYNTNRGYSYIMMYEPGFLFYKDSIYNITPDVVAGLNDEYKKKKDGKKK